MNSVALPVVQTEKRAQSCDCHGRNEWKGASGEH